MCIRDRRETLRAVQTPQAFRFGLILSSHREAAAEGVEGLTDDAAVSEWAGHLVHIFEGDAANMKITESADFAKAETRLLAQLGDVRMGQGYDAVSYTHLDVYKRQPPYGPRLCAGCSGPRDIH